jgi:hypothetical protein
MNEPVPPANESEKDESPQESLVGFLQRWSRETVFWVNIGFAATVLLLAIVTAAYDGQPETKFLMGVPLSVVWFGVLGAVLCSMQGIIEHNEDYDQRFNYWHFARPIVGGIVGLMSYLILTVIVTLGGSTPPSFAAAPTAPLNLNLYHVAAFIVGYREDAFRDLVSRVTELVLRPGSTRSPAIKTEQTGSKRSHDKP